MHAKSVTDWREAIAADIATAKRRGYGVAHIAADLDKSQEWVYKLTDGTTVLPAHRLGDWVRATGGNALLMHVAQGAGYMATPQPESDGRPNMAHTLREFADVVQQVGAAYEDGACSVHEAALIEREGREAQVAIEALIAQAKANAGRRRPTTLQAAS